MSQPLADAQVANPRRIEWLLYISAGTLACLKIRRSIVTAHGSDAYALAALCPTTQIEPDRLYIQDDDLFTSAGVTAGIDLSLNLVSKDHGPKVALNVAKRLVVFTQRSGGQS